MEKSTFEVRLTCSDCQFSDTVKREDGTGVMICRVDPSTMAYAFIPKGPDSGVFLTRYVWREILPSDWCGKLRQRGN